MGAEARTEIREHDDETEIHGPFPRREACHSPRLGSLVFARFDFPRRRSFTQEWQKIRQRPDPLPI